MEIKEHPKASIEVRKHFDYYWNKSFAAAEKFNQAYIAAVEHIRKYPTINPIAILKPVAFLALRKYSAQLTKG